jgi:prolyl-tRNA editing enzyme YbaK/EbsC (Cys-tRNA(Pro) deacylase)
MTSRTHPSISKFEAALREAGLPTAADGIRILDDEVRTAAAAAQALGVPVGAIANSLMFRAGDTPLLALTSGAHRASPARLAELVGVPKVSMADPEFVKEHTGQSIGGVAPVGHPRPIRTLVDRDLETYPVLWAAAGHPKAVFPTTFAELVTLTGGVAANVSGEEENPRP